MSKECKEVKRILDSQYALPYCSFNSLLHNKAYTGCTELCPYSYFTSDSKEYIGCTIFTARLQ